MTSSETSSRPRPWWRWPLIGCGIGVGLAIAITAVIVAVLVILGLAVKEAVEEERVATSLALGEPATIDGLQVIVDRYEMSDTAGGAPPSGARFLLVHLTARNVGNVPIDEYLDRSIQYRGGEVGGSFPGGSQYPMFDPLVRLFPGISSEGWLLFEVPIDLDLSEVSVAIKLGPFPPKVATWRLAEPENADGR